MAPCRCKQSRCEQRASLIVQGIPKSNVKMAETLLQTSMLGVIHHPDFGASTAPQMFGSIKNLMVKPLSNNIQRAAKHIDGEELNP